MMEPKPSGELEITRTTDGPGDNQIDVAEDTREAAPRAHGATPFAVDATSNAIL